LIAAFESGIFMAITSPIVVDLGSMTDLEVKELLSGAGRLRDELTEVIRRVRASVAAQDDEMFLIPVVAVYSEHRRADSGWKASMDAKPSRRRDRK
jgi:hypothetical protein